MKGIFLDIETTGLDPSRHKPIDIAFKVLELSSGTLLGDYQSIIKVSSEAWQSKDPSSILVNGFTWDEIVQGKDLKIVSQEIISQLNNLKIERGKSFFICQNPAFDRGFFIHLVDVYKQEQMNWPYHWLDLASMYWAMLVHRTIQTGAAWPTQISLSKNDIAQAYHLPPENSPHRAMKGVDHLITCYKAVLGVK